MKTIKFLFRGLFITLVVPIFFSCEEIQLDQDTATDANFLSYSLGDETLPAVVNVTGHHVSVEVANSTDLTQLVPIFTIPEGSSATVSGKEQVSGQSVLDFSQPVMYKITDAIGKSQEWMVEVKELTCKILIDASHGGGTWWFPQSPETGFDQNAYHQGKAFADYLRGKGFQVDELPRGIPLTDDLFHGYFIVIRTNGFTAYSEAELEVYKTLLGRGMNLAMFTDHKKYDTQDELADFLGIQFEGVANGTVSKFADHPITAGLSDLGYIAGAVLTNADNPDIEVLGWLSDTDYADFNFNGVRDNGEPTGMPVMGVLHRPGSKIFFFGDMNAFEIRPQPFIDNLTDWIGNCNL